MRSTTAHAFLQNQPPPQSQYHPASSNMGFGPTPSTVAASHAPPPQPTVAAPSQITVPSNMANTSATVGASVPRPATTTPRVPTLRELWDIRREITALQARGRNVAADLRAAGQQIPLGPEDATPPSMTGGGTPSSGADLLKMRELEADIVGTCSPFYVFPRFPIVTCAPPYSSTSTPLLSACVDASNIRNHPRTRSFACACLDDRTAFGPSSTIVTGSVSPSLAPTARPRN